MKRQMVFLMLLAGMIFGQQSIVRVYTGDRSDLKKISAKQDLDIAGVKAGVYYDIVADPELLSCIIGSGLGYEIIVPDLEGAKDSVRADYLSYSEMEDSLRQLALDYPAICKFDSLPIPTYEGNWIYGIKISDNPQLEEDDEPGFLIDGTHHAREWACVPTVMFFADSMLSAYDSVPEIAEIINGTEIYCFPVINVDGYIYDYPAGEWWRKNREPFGGSTGADCNRNYGGCSDDIEGDWGAVDEDQATHRPSYATFCGAYVNSGDETRALTMYVKEHIINAYMSYHSSGELLMWPWGWTGAQNPDFSTYNQVGNYMANQVQRLGGGTYDRGSIYNAIYAVSGSSVDWVYSWCHWVGGRSNLAFTTEIGTSFYQPVSDLDNIAHQNFKALKYLAGYCDSLVLLLDGVVPAPAIYTVGAVDPDYTVAWHAINVEDNHPTQWELIELSNPSVIEDSLEAGTDRWLLDGFTLSTTQAHSGTHSFFSGSMNEMNHAVMTQHPYLVEASDSVTFWCWYDLENNYDAAVVEVSENTKEWFNLDTTRFNGNSSGWIRKAYSLDDCVGKSVYIRFRAMTDGGTLNNGFYVDDIAPVVLFAEVDTVASNITDTLYSFTGHAAGDFYYLTRGHNSTWGWGDYSCLAQAAVAYGVSEGEAPATTCIMPSISLTQNPIVDQLHINYTLGNTNPEAARLDIYDAAGRLVKSFRNIPSGGRGLSSQGDGAPCALRTTLSWDGRDDSGRALPNGVYFVEFIAGAYQQVEKAVILK